MNNSPHFHTLLDLYIAGHLESILITIAIIIIGIANTINAIIEAMDAKDAFTMGRSRRVTFYALKMANALNLDEDVKNKIEYYHLTPDSTRFTKYTLDMWFGIVGLLNNNV